MLQGLEAELGCYIVAYRLEPQLVV